MTRSTVARRSLSLITKHGNSRMDVLTLGSNRGEEILPVFSHEEEAEAFLRLQAPGKGWWARGPMTGQLVSLLYGLGTSIEKVVLDPLSVAIDNWVVVDLKGPGRENFLRNFLGVDEPSFTDQRERVQAGKEHGRTDKEAARRGDALNGASEGSDNLYVPDYVMRDFSPSDDLRNGYEARPRVSEIPGEDLMQRHE